MPPRVESIPKPKTRGADAREYLEAHGIVARKLPVRSSDYERCQRDPFGYYLTRRLGLTDGLSYSEALTKGSWFHVGFENLLKPVMLQRRIRTERLEARFGELTQLCREHGISSEGRHRILEKEEHDAQTAWAWWDVAKDLPLREGGPSTMEWFNLPHLDVLGFEVPVRLKILGIECQLQYDALVYHRNQNKVWAVDVKTTALQPLDRAATCQIEFQTQLYLHGLNVLCRTGLLQDMFDVPDGAQPGGFRHIIIQKPTIKFGQMDRDCTEHEHELLRGPRKGQVETRRVYEGEPRIENYVRRIGEWYRKDGMYSHLEGEEGPRVGYSDVSSSLMEDPSEVQEFRDRLTLVNRYATMSPEPKNFPRTVSGCTGRGKLSHLAPFYVCPVDQWPTIIRELQLKQAWRDGDIDES